MQGDQRRFTFQTLAVRRVAHYGARRAFRQWIGQFSDVVDVKGYQFGNACTTGIAARHFNHPTIDIRTEET
ncbi:hypothetical protein D3C76_1337400 [compost metagenome]